MKVITIWQPWASLIMIGAKPVEWRRWHGPRWIQGQRIGIHAGARKVEKIEVAQIIMDCVREGRQRLEGVPVDKPTGLDIELSLALLSSVLKDLDSLPRSALLGTAVIGEPQLAGALGHPVDSGRLDQQKWGWPLTDVETFPEPVPMKGGQGFWTYQDAGAAMRDFVGTL